MNLSAASPRFQRWFAELPDIERERLEAVYEDAKRDPEYAPNHRNADHFLLSSVIEAAAEFGYEP